MLQAKLSNKLAGAIKFGTGIDRILKHDQDINIGCGC
jgi:hypothetical protein